MEKRDVCRLTNEYGKRFVEDWLKNYEILGVEQHGSANRQEFDVIYRRTDKTIGVAVLPNHDSKNDGSCFFGDFDYYVIVYALEYAGIPIKWPSACTGRSYPIHPAWYEDDEKKLAKYREAYAELYNKYDPLPF